MQTIHAPCDATVLKCDLKEGEFADAGLKREEAPIHLSLAGAMEVRVEFDQEESARIPLSGAAIGKLRGRTETALTLEFIRVEPSLQAKRTFLGHGTERVDTRVMEIIYRIAGPNGILGPENRIRPGQSVDVMVDMTAPDRG
jgi:HlyD family secretion protein